MARRARPHRCQPSDLACTAIRYRGSTSEKTAERCKARQILHLLQQYCDTSSAVRAIPTCTREGRWGSVAWANRESGIFVLGGGERPSTVAASSVDQPALIEHK